MVSRFLDRVRAWIALTLVGLAYRISPRDVLPARQSTVDLPGGRPTLFRVNRALAGTGWCLYEGPSGGEARRIFEDVKARGELGLMTLTMSDGASAPVVRGTYTGKSK